LGHPLSKIFENRSVGGGKWYCKSNARNVQAISTNSPRGGHRRSPYEPMLFCKRSLDPYRYLSGNASEKDEKLSEGAQTFTMEKVRLVRLKSG